ncbi:MAG: NAD-dependent deacetylase [Bacteroidota bacterium]
METKSSLDISDKLKNVLHAASRVTVFTGAGISAESGVPTFRGVDGIWKKFKPEELANFDAFIKNPDLVWEWYKHRKTIITGIEPNAGHYALAGMEKLYSLFSIITQNIDNLHRRAGSKNIYELHGNIERNYCIGCGKFYPNEEIFKSSSVPRCSACHGLIRPDVVWFGEMLPADAWNDSVRAAEHCDLFFSIGTSAVVYPAASLPQMAKNSGAYTVEINIERTEFSTRADEVIIGKAAETLPRILAIVQKLDLHK